MSANEKSPSHYTSHYQHWDLAVLIPLGYLEGCSTKYVARWRHKGGIDDLHKALHYLDKLIEVYGSKPLARNLNRSEIQYEVSRFAAANKLSIIEEEYVLLLSNYRYEDDLRTAKLVLEDIIELAKGESKRAIPEPNYPGTTDDGGHHAAGQADSEELETK
jgi:hypothetical protein